MSTKTPYFQWRPHPWHGIEVGPEPPKFVNAYIEITPFDLVKYEVDKVTGYLCVDRPQRTSSMPPSLYGFIPRTLCGPNVKALSPKATRGDGDPMDIVVISERPITKAEVILNAKVIGALQMLDGGEADDKVIGVLVNDSIWGNVEDISGLPKALVDRLIHYFSTYKMVPGEKNQVTIEQVLDAKQALALVDAAIKDYENTYGLEKR